MAAIVGEARQVLLKTDPLLHITSDHAASTPSSNSGPVYCKPLLRITPGDPGVPAMPEEHHYPDILRAKSDGLDCWHSTLCAWVCALLPHSLLHGQHEAGKGED